jgi:hypothetical protein
VLIGGNALRADIHRVVNCPIAEMSNAFSFLSRFLRPGGATSGYSLAENYVVLRDAVFSTNPDTLRIVGAASPEGIWCVVMETGYPGAVATLVAVADGSVSLYFSNGGGIIGLGGQEGPQRASRALLDAAPEFRNAFEPTTKYPLPRESHVRFYLLTRESVLTCEAKEEELGGEHALSPLFSMAHELITQIRIVDEKRQGEPPQNADRA